MFLLGCNNTSQQEHSVSGKYYRLTTEELSLINDGDIILRQGQGLVSNLIMKTLNENFALSHVGIITKSNEGKLDVIHSVSSTLSDFDGIQVQDLSNFIKESVPNSVIVVRYNKGENKKETKNSISAQAQEFLDLKIPFDHSFDFADTTKFFCSELIWRVFKEVYDDEIFPPSINQMNVENLKFYHFLNEEKFKIIINHQNN